ncbi:hypothetical protein BDF14DRAFT_1775253 [Spinellus fusiger]|nr:hypothetical protein BDF14DRAFT_1775253 [Spinellus fusiger]
MTHLPIQWEKRHFQLSYPDLETLESVTVGDVKNKCSTVTGVPVEAMTLFVHGAIMNNDQLSLQKYSYRPGSKIILNTVFKSKHSPTKDKAHPYTSDALTLKILGVTQTRLEATLTVAVDAFEKAVREYLESKTPKDTEAPAETNQHQLKALQRKALEWGEQLMQVLFDLDEISMRPGFDVARQKRKQAVTTTQALIDRVDAMQWLLAHR